MTRAGRYAFQKGWEKRARIFRRHWAVLLGLAGCFALALAFCLFVDTPATEFVSGALVVTFLWMLWFFMDVAHGIHLTDLGGYAERDTSKRLKRALGRNWRVIDHVEFTNYEPDIDHIVIGPSAVFAIETKFFLRECIVGPSSVECGQDLIAQAHARATKARSLFRSAKCIVDVEPVLILTGLGVTVEDEWPTYIDGVRIVSLEDLKSWTAEFVSRPGDNDVAKLADIVHNYVKKRDSKTAKGKPRGTLDIRRASATTRFRRVS